MIVNNEDFKKKLKYLGFGISKTSLLPNTKIIKFCTIDGKVYGFTYDGINNIKVYIGDTDKDFSAYVNYEMFTNFIKSCDGDITLESTDNYVKVKSFNVKSKISTFNPVIEGGGIPNPDNGYNYTEDLVADFKLGILKSILDPNHIVECYRKIYFGDAIMVSDTDNVIIIKNKIFTKNIMLNLSSVDMLNNLTNIKYCFVKSASVAKLCIQSDEMWATIIIGLNEDGNFQYDESMELFDTMLGKYVEIDTKVLSKAMNTSQLFKVNPNIEFNSAGVFLTITNSDFVYKIAPDPCDDRIYELTPNVVKQICSLGNIVKMFYMNDNFIRCDSDDTSEILSVKTICSQGGET